jgi:outer membrane protein
MNKFLASLCAAIAFLGLAAAPAIAQSTPKILVVDMAKLLDGHHKTAEHLEKIKGAQAKANEELEKLRKEIAGLEEQLKQLDGDVQNPALSTDAREKIRTDFRTKFEERQKKINELNTFFGENQRSFQRRMENFRKLMFEEIAVTVTDIAKKKGGTLVLDKSGPSLIGINPVVYADKDQDITEEVQKELNKGRPAGSPAAPAAPAASATDSDAKVSFPGAK